MIQLTKLSKTLTKNYTAWMKKDHHDYILSEHFILKTNQNIKGSALNKLISLLGNLPIEGEGIQNRHGDIREMTEDEMKNWMDLLNDKGAKTICFTNLIHQTDKDLYSIFMGDGEYIFVNKVYIDLVNIYEEDVKILGSTKVSPVYFKKENEEIMILPVRLKEEPFHLKGLKND